MNKKIEKQVIEDFGKEWQKFNQRDTAVSDLERMFEDYFHILPKKYMNKEMEWRSYYI